MTLNSGKNLWVVRLGRTRYADAWELQRQVFDARTEQRLPDTLLLTEHEHVFTLGKGADQNHLLASEEELRWKGIDVFRIDRGGDVTYHGPGQLVGYPILDLHQHHTDIHRYLRDIEEVLIRVVGDHGKDAVRNDGYTGAWVGENKIAAIGVKVSRWITMHGFALNVSTDLSYFDRIIPCGIFHKGVTSLKEELGIAPEMHRVEELVAHHFDGVFGTRSQWISIRELRSILEPADAAAVEGAA